MAREDRIGWESPPPPPWFPSRALPPERSREGETVCAWAPAIYLSAAVIPRPTSLPRFFLTRCLFTTHNHHEGKKHIHFHFICRGSSHRAGRQGALVRQLSLNNAPVLQQRRTPPCSHHHAPTPKNVDSQNPLAQATGQTSS